MPDADEATPPSCPECKDRGWWLDGDGFRYCDCSAGAKAQEEDEGGY